MLLIIRLEVEEEKELNQRLLKEMLLLELKLVISGQGELDMSSKIENKLKYSKMQKPLGLANSIFEIHKISEFSGLIKFPEMGGEF
jgi:hypothetical protein